MLDKIMTRCEGLVGGDQVFVMNALSQTCTVSEAPWILYRPTNHAKLVTFLGLTPTRVEPLMTYDAHLFFATAEEAERGAEILRSAEIDGKRLFVVEPDAHDPKKLFYRVGMHDPVLAEAQFACQGLSASFSDHFTAIVQRTGKHTQRGNLFCNIETETRELANYEIMAWLDDVMAVGDRTLVPVA